MHEKACVSRRGLLRASVLGGIMLTACTQTPGGSSFAPAPSLVPIRARTDRIIDIADCQSPEIAKKYFDPKNPMDFYG